MDGYTIPVICPRCDNLLGHTDGKRGFMTASWGNAIPISTIDNDVVIILGYTITCDCGYEWDWKPGSNGRKT